MIPNLQGIWTGTWTPAWSGDWTLDSNLQLAMNSMCSANLVEFTEPYARLLEAWVPNMRINARKVYGARGIVANTRASNTCLLLHTYDWVAELWRRKSIGLARPKSGSGRPSLTATTSRTA